VRSFEASRLEELPAWLNGPQGRGYVKALARGMDVELKGLKFAIKQLFVTTCQDEALLDLGATYVIEQFPGEPNATYRVRLKHAWPTWGEAGLRDAIIDSLQAYGLGDVEVYELNAV